MEIVKWVFVIFLALLAIHRITSLISNDMSWELKYEITYLVESIVTSIAAVIILKF